MATADFPRTAAPATTAVLLALARACRPSQWAKNVFVFAPLLFSGQAGSLPAWLASGWAFAAFCLLSSAGYCINDVIDAPADRRHPRKRHRPVAAGLLEPSTALLFAALLLSVVVLAAAQLPASFLLMCGLYLANQLLYCWHLKHHVLLDVMAIAVGFVLRLLAGCFALGVEPTSWLLVCGFSLALMLGFGKRRMEIVLLSNRTDFRPVLRVYSVEMLNLLLGICAVLCLMSYVLYATAPGTVRLHGTDKLVLTVPFVAYGLFRFILRVLEGRHDGPVDVLARDPAFAINGALWVVAVLVILYLPEVRAWPPSP